MPLRRNETTFAHERFETPLLGKQLSLSPLGLVEKPRPRHALRFTAYSLQPRENYGSKCRRCRRAPAEEEEGDGFFVFTQKIDDMPRAAF